MNTLIANQYGRVQGEVGGNGLVLSVAAETPRRESVHLQMRVDSVEQQLYLLAILRAVERRIEQFQLRDSNAAESQAEGRASPLRGRASREGAWSNQKGHSRTRSYEPLPHFWTTG